MCVARYGGAAAADARSLSTDFAHDAVAPLLPPRLRPLRLDATALARLQAARAAACTRYDDGDPAHAALLSGLWSAALPGRPFPRAGVSAAWTEAGWQGPDPRTDLRGAGVGALAHLVWLSRADARLFRRLATKRGRNPPHVAVNEYPFCAAGANVTLWIAAAAGLHSGGGAAPAAGPPRGAPARGFAALLAAHEIEASTSITLAPYGGGEGGGNDCHGAAALAVVGALYAATFEALDDVWAARRLDYMQFPSAAADVQAALAGALAARPPSVEAAAADLRRRVGCKP